MQRTELPVSTEQSTNFREGATAADVSIFCWNVNNRVGLTTFRPEAAQAAMETDADVLVFNEFFPGLRLEPFQGSLHAAGWSHQAMSEPVDLRANRILVASRLPLHMQSLPPSTVDGHLTANALCLDIGVLRVLALRVPTYKGISRRHAWDWITEVSAGLKECGRPSVIVGDLNTSLTATGSARMEQFHRLLGSGWTRAEPDGVGSFSRGDTWLEIDHVLATASCRVSRAQYVQRTSSYVLAGTKGSLSDHAGLMFTASRNDTNVSN